VSARCTPRSWLAIIAATLALAGCGAAPPQAPSKQAAKLDAATSDIATECGLSDQVTAFPGHDAKELANLETQAKASVHSLASVYNLNPAWIYQGETVRQIVAAALETLDACRLTEAERTLRRATS
jgi:hypothetical protein